MNTPIAIIGMGSLFPKAQSLRDYWRNIRNGVDAITEVPASHWSADEYFDKDPASPDHTYSRRGGFLSPYAFDPLAFGVPPSALEATDTSQLLGLVVAKAALEDAGYGETREFDRDKVSVVLGVTGTLELVIPLGARLGHPIWRKALHDAGIPKEKAQEVVERISAGYVPWQENSFPGLLGNVVAGRIANRLNLGGTNCVVDAACASSLSATHLAILELADGRSDMVVTGGVDTFNDIFMYMCFSKTPALSPTGDARPFDEAADGTILGEGIGMLVLKRLADAERDGDRIYSVIRGMGTSSDGRSKSIYAPRSEGQAKALRAAYANAGFAPDTVELVEAHGTGTKAGDAAEIESLKMVYGDAGGGPAWCALGSVKSQIGHTKAAAGAAGLMKAALALHHKVLPPTIKVKTPSAKLGLENSPFYLNTEARPWAAQAQHPRRAAVSAFGFGGSNFHAVLEEYRPEKMEISWDGSTEIVALSAASGTELKSLLAAWKTAAASGLTHEQLARKAMAARKAFRASDAHRLVFTLDSSAELAKKIEQASVALERESGKAWELPDGVYYGVGAVAGKTAFIFPGQGSQYVAMGRELVCTFPEAQRALEQANETLLADGLRLSDKIFPQQTFSEDVRRHQRSSLTATDVAQPALGALSVAWLRVLEQFGVAADAVAGHSFGELVALCAAGRIDAASLHQLARLRGKLMAEAGTVAGDTGSMLAVRAPLAEIEKFLVAEKLDLVLANRNGPTQGVLSGSKAEIARAIAACRVAGLTAKELTVAAAFHSPLVAHAAKPFALEVSGVKFTTGRIPVYSNTTADVYPADAADASSLLAQQLAEPVDFSGMIENLYRDGVRCFIEVGPKSTLTGLVAAILAGRPHQALSVDSSAGRRSAQADLARTLAQFAAQGHAVKLELWEKVDEHQLVAPEPKMTVMLSGANHRSSVAKVKPAVTPATLPVSLPIAASAAVARIAVPAPAAVLHTSAVPATPALLPGYSPGALSSAQESLKALQALHQQTAALHKQFLEGQEAAQRAYQTLFEQQSQSLTMPRSYVAALPVAPVVAQVSPQLVAQTVAPVAAAPARVTSAFDSANLERVLLAVVSEKTGYPSETLQLDMDLESDLGIDSIKRVEILAGIRERIPSAPSVDPEHLGGLRTLRQIVSFISERATAGVQATVSVPVAASVPGTGSFSRSNLEQVLLQVVSEKTGYPSETLQLDMDLESDLGIDSIKRVEILAGIRERIPSAPSVDPEHLGGLRTLRQIVTFISDRAEAVVAAPAASASSVAGSSSQLDSANLERVLLIVVSEKTGYPAETLQLDMDLESDLGIDSIKRVEILAGIRERIPEAPSVDPEHLGGLRTLRQIVSFIASKADTVAAVAPPLKPVAATAAPVMASLSDAVFLDRRVLRPLALPVLGDATIAIAAGHEVLVTENGTPLAQEIVRQLGARKIAARVIACDSPLASRQAPVAGLILLAPAAAVQGAAWPVSSELFLKNAFQLVKTVGADLRAAARKGGAVLATLSRLDGSFASQDKLDQAVDPLQGGLAGLTKTVAAEWPEVRARALDAAADWDVREVALAVIRELAVAQPLEIGLSAGVRLGLELVEASLERGVFNLAATDVIVVTGGARGVTAQAALALAKAAHPTLVLIGRSLAPEPEPVWLAGIETEAEIKKALAADVASRGEKPNPRAIGAAFKKIAANREITQTLAKIGEHARVLYRSADMRDEAGLTTILNEVRGTIGPIRGLVHGAGLLEDKLIEDKTLEQFEAVVDTKIAGLRILLEATAGDELRYLALFSSISGRLGRRGQVDYAMANEVLNKVARRESQRRPACRVVSINWGPWDGGMVGPGLSREFAKEGVPLIPLLAGAEAFVTELSAAPGSPIEVIVGGPVAASAQLAVTKTNVAARSVGAELSVAFERTVQVARNPFLMSHVLAGRPVLPLAMIMEWLAHAALHGNPGLHFHGFKDLRVLRGLTFETDTVDVSVLATPAQAVGGFYELSVELRSGNGKAAHARATAVLTSQMPAAPDPRASDGLIDGAYERSVESAYNDVLFHGDHFRGIQEVLGISPHGITARVKPAPDPSKWTSDSLRSAWIADPLIIDAGFQLAILWCQQKLGAPSLPARVGSYRQFRAFPREDVMVSFLPRDASALRVTGDLVFSAMATTGERGLIAMIEDYECTVDPRLTAAFKRPGSTQHTSPMLSI